MIDIEFSHIYGNEDYGVIHTRSIELAHGVVEKQPFPYRTTVLLDDFHGQPCRWNDHELMGKIEQDGIRPDAIIRESSLAPMALMIPNHIPELFKKKKMFRGKEQIFFSDEDGDFGLIREGKPVCALLSASYLLCRLGLGKFPSRPNQYDGTYQHALACMTILPHEYKGVEKKVCKILHSMGYGDKLKDIHYIFFTEDDHEILSGNSLIGL